MDLYHSLLTEWQALIINQSHPDIATTIISIFNFCLTDQFLWGSFQVKTRVPEKESQRITSVDCWWEIFIGQTPFHSTNSEQTQHHPYISHN